MVVKRKAEVAFVNNGFIIATDERTTVWDTWDEFLNGLAIEFGVNKPTPKYNSPEEQLYIEGLISEAEYQSIVYPENIEEKENDNGETNCSTKKG